MRLQLVGMQVFQVACKDNSVAFLGIDTVDSLLQETVINALTSTHVSIRELHEAVAVESLGQVVEDILHMAHLYLLVATERAIAYHYIYK